MLVQSVQNEDGLVLKLIGDERLTTFDDHTDALFHPGQRAIESALHIQRVLKSPHPSNRRHAGGPARVHIDIHFSPTTYAKIGNPSPLDFTVIGSTDNLTARLESRCG